MEQQRYEKLCFCLTPVPQHAVREQVQKIFLKKIGYSQTVRFEKKAVPEVVYVAKNNAAKVCHMEVKACFYKWILSFIIR